MPPASQRDRKIRATVARYIRSLIELYQITDPSQGAASEEDKLERARRAIELWWYLYGELLQWAQSQIAGYEFARSNPKIIENLSKILDHEITVDSHVLEYIGLTFSLNRVNNADPTIETFDKLMEQYGAHWGDTSMRSLIRELLMSRSANSSFWRFELQEALYALNQGHVEDIVRPEAIRRQGHPIKLLSWKIRALQHVYFHIGKGMKKYRALQTVGEALGQSTETLRSWEKSICCEEDWARELEATRIAGELEDRFDELSIKKMSETYDAEYYRNVSSLERARFA